MSRHGSALVQTARLHLTGRREVPLRRGVATSRPELAGRAVSLQSLAGGRCSGRDELQGHTVVAPPLAGRRRPVLEHVPLVAAATGAVIFGPGQDQLEVPLGLHVTLDVGEEAGPPGTAVELHLGREQRQLASRAYELSLVFLFIEGAGEGPFRPFVAQHLELLRRQQPLPLLLGPLDLSSFPALAMSPPRIRVPAAATAVAPRQPIKKPRLFMVSGSERSYPSSSNSVQPRAQVPGPRRSTPPARAQGDRRNGERVPRSGRESGSAVACCRGEHPARATNGGRVRSNEIRPLATPNADRRSRRYWVEAGRTTSPATRNSSDARNLTSQSRKMRRTRSGRPRKLLASPRLSTLSP